jgi:uracil-DNA glycosylase
MCRRDPKVRGDAVQAKRAFERGEIVETPLARWTTATYHPSALLRVPKAEQRELMRAQFTEDLKAVAKLSAKLAARS